MGGRLVPVTIDSPAIFGVNRQQSGEALPLEWAVEAENLVISDTGKLASRKGFREAADLGTVFVQHEYIDGLGENYLIFTTATQIHIMSENGQTADVTGEALAGGYWEFVNIRGGVLGMQAGVPSIFLENSGDTFKAVTNTTTSTIGAVTPSLKAHAPLASLGRLWCLDGLRLLYTDTLTYDVWDGVFDLSLVWLNGADNPTALSYFNGDLVIFGEDSIIVYQGNLDPLLLELRESVGGLGCPFPRTIQAVGNDLLFLSRSGVRSLGRTLQEGKMPLGNATTQVQEYLTGLVRDAGINEVQAVFDGNLGYYVLMVLRQKTAIVLHTRLSTPLGTPPITEWKAEFTSLGMLRGRIFLGVGQLLTEYRRTGDSLGGGVTVATPLKLRLPWWGIDDAGEISQRLKMLKQATVSVSGYTSAPIKLCWALDYQGDVACEEKKIIVGDPPVYTNPPAGTIPPEEYENHAWFGETPFVQVFGQNALKFGLRKSGLVVQFEVSTETKTEPVIFQSIRFLIKVGAITV